MLRGIGSQKPKIFGIMDLTQSYHQAPLTLATRAYTAFITFSVHTTAIWTLTSSVILLENNDHCSTYRTCIYDLLKVY